MSRHHELTDLADQDVFNLSLYLARQAGLDRAERFIDSLDQKFQLLADTPGAGRQREELAPSLRSFPFNPYVIFYRPTSYGILVIRVLHGSRDLDTIFPAGQGDA